MNKNLVQALRTTKNHLAKLDYLGVKTIGDFLQFYPRTYLDRSVFNTVSNLMANEIATLKGTISSLTQSKSQFGKMLIQALFTDSTGSIEVIWFNQPYLLRMFRPGMEVILSGPVKYRMGRPNLVSPEFEFLRDEQVHTARIIPVYHETEGISSKWMREKIKPLLEYADYFQEYLPRQILESERLLPLNEAIKQIHFPENMESLRRARERLGFDELFIIQLLALIRKKKWHEGAENFYKKIEHESEVSDYFIRNLPFELTGAQKRSLFEILEDVKKPVPMLRLLQGDVGSGKTIVAAAALYSAVKAGYQGALMVPTEVLARQHFDNFKKLFEPHGIRVEILVGSLKEKEKRNVSENISLGLIDIIIGTHALIQEYIGFKNLGLAVIDEQHRFGVKQRDILKKHGFPHLLNMSATPIPRSLAMTLYGDQDLSLIDEMPPGRQKIMTRIVPDSKRRDAYGWIQEQIRQGRQVYVICPLIDESDFLEVKSAIQESEYLARDVFPEFKIGLMHGKLRPRDKEQVMKDFNEGNIQVLVSTSVVEVGIDVSNATIMMIEGAERFGLSQLHQFRGRVGRGQHQSYCFLFTKAYNQDSVMRLESLVKHHDGFKLAEIDLQIRGPGEIYGVRQSGIPDLKMASISDSGLMKRARTQAENILFTDPNFMQHPELLKKLEKYFMDEP
ncbi:ATP-dependent DNA helicase RecG [Candidatus Peregrinibacteria bacterium]|nr:ATP-dependent DNA helicase RecG [Candidatus Peregrinibacteria bacterium]